MDDSDIIATMCAAVASGAAVCLLGAGFSRQAKDSQGHAVPSTEELTSEIRTALSIDTPEVISLSDIADFAEESSQSDTLKKLLTSRLTVTKPSPSQNDFLSYKWRAAFTTNFDDIVERSDSKDHFYSITPEGGR